MSLDSPQVVAGPVSGRQRYIAALLTRKRLIIQLIVLTIIVGTTAYLWFGVHNKNEKNNTSNSSGVEHTTPAAADIGIYKGSTGPDELRVLVNSYADAGDYKSAYDSANTLVDKTNSPDDYMTLLWLCTLYEVPHKSNCIDNTSSKLKEIINSLSFINTYMAGSLLEQSGRKDEAVDFYERAYLIYDVKTADGNIMTKEQLKKHIDGLR